MERMNVSFPYLNFFFSFGAIFQRERIHLAQGRKISSIFIFMYVITLLKCVWLFLSGYLECGNAELDVLL